MCGHLAAPSLDVRRTCANVLMHAVSNAFDTGDDEDLLDFGDLFDDPNGILYMATMRLRRSFSAKMELGVFSALRRPSCIETTLADLPSWVPDWSYDFYSDPDEEKGPSGINNPIIRENVRTPIMLEMVDAFPEWEVSRSNTSFNARLSSDGKTLILRGMILDELNHVGDKLEYPYSGPEQQSEDVVMDSIHEFKRSWRIYRSIGAAMDTIKGWQDLAFENKNLQIMSGETRMDEQSLEDPRTTHRKENHRH
ncbi:hypothetical protein BFJ69_g11019 [Fusarium oxysporum]|uniref:Uncharacterized protein n=1 Tax=Fusarium oxysporum TaxID=5507 RepID=A0A420MTJ4_FUSOX|nr:hypothetical protein BFJ69_g11019 [Fusarium oxysporum]